MLGEGMEPFSLVNILVTNLCQVNDLKFICQVHGLYYGHK